MPSDPAEELEALLRRSGTAELDLTDEATARLLLEHIRSLVACWPKLDAGEREEVVQMVFSAFAQALRPGGSFKERIHVYIHWLDALKEELQASITVRRNAYERILELDGSAQLAAEDHATIAYTTNDPEQAELLEAMQPFIRAELTERDPFASQAIHGSDELERLQALTAFVAAELDHDELDHEVLR